MTTDEIRAHAVAIVLEHQLIGHKFPRASRLFAIQRAVEERLGRRLNDRDMQDEGWRIFDVIYTWMYDDTHTIRRDE